MLQSEHIAAKRIPLETKVEIIDTLVRSKSHLTFEELLEDDPSVENRVVSLLALLELSKRGAVELRQPVLFGEITIDAIQGSPVFRASDEAASLSAGTV